MTCPESTRLPSRTAEVSELPRSRRSHPVTTAISLNTGLQYGRQSILGELGALGTPESHLLIFKTLWTLKIKAREIWPHSLPRQALVRDKEGMASLAELRDNHPILRKFSLISEE